VIRLEQLYPLGDELDELLARRAPAPLVWVQDEPRNLGGWRYIADRLRQQSPSCVARPDSPSPATGSGERYRREQAELLARAFA
jgi:2-oxoglutarate dehydrogenase E1 component